MAYTYVTLHTHEGLQRIVRLRKPAKEIVESGEFLVNHDPENEVDDELVIERELRDQDINFENYAAKPADVFETDVGSLDLAVTVFVINPVAKTIEPRVIHGATTNELVEEIEALVGGEVAALTYAEHMTALWKHEAEEEEQQGFFHLISPVEAREHGELFTFPGRTVLIGAGPEGEFLSLPPDLIDKITIEWDVEPF